MTEGEPYTDDDLAAEYVLGVLDADMRREVTARIGRDMAFARRVTAWSERLAGLNDGYAPAAPPKHVKSAIDNRLFPSRPRRNWWRALAAATVSGLAAVAVFVFFMAGVPNKYTAQLRADGSEFAFEVQVIGGELEVAQLQGSLPDGQSLEIWHIVGEAAPVSLGLLGESAAPPDVPYSQGQIIAVSLEPLGGSPTGAPTGPVVAMGTLEKSGTDETL